jgi:natural product biosynthesis luciferase-like monooxygenase protein/amino acid adenylation domain-containing protein
MSTGGPSDYRALLTQALVAIRELKQRVADFERDRAEPIALIGIGCRFPAGADSPDALWRVLRAGTDAIDTVPADRWDVNAYYDANPEAAGKAHTRWAALLDTVDAFDPQFFGISPREATHMDPQHRLLLETAWEAIEHAGIPANLLRGSQAGVFVGIGSDDYLQLGMHLAHAAEIDAYAALGTARSIAAGRIAHTLGLRGPAIQLDTSCSSSLVAVHLACQSLRRGECDLALAGGVHLMLSPLGSIARSKVRAVSPDGRSRAFDAAANGFGLGEGCAIVVLKRLSRAEADSDRVVALIRGSAVNHDGRSGGLTIPNQTAQEDVIRQALVEAHVRPEDVSYVEAHGTGTSLGDPIEIAALNTVFGPTHTPAEPLIVGSVKTNFGHLEAAAGIVGLAKVALGLEHGEIPPHLHLREPNPQIPWASLPVAIPTVVQTWPRRNGRRIAGVSSFGMSGTNAHVVMEEGPTRTPVRRTRERRGHVLTLSAKTSAALGDLAGRFAEALEALDRDALADWCFSANTGRAPLAHRLAATCTEPNDLRSNLLAFATRPGDVPGVRSGIVDLSSARPGIAFRFGSEDVTDAAEPARELYEAQAAFRHAIDAGDALARANGQVSILDVLFTSPDTVQASARETIDRIRLCLQYGWIVLWRSWGVSPQSVVGQGAGAYAAAVASGLPLEDALRMAAAGTPPPDLLREKPDDGMVLVDVAVGTSGSWWPTILDSLARLFVAGVPIDWNAFDRDYDRHRVAVPTYPFQRARYWSRAAAAELLRPAAADRSDTPSDLGGVGLVNATPESERQSLEALRRSLRGVVGELLRLAPDAVPPHEPLLELGADSLILVDLIRRVEERYAVRLTVRQLFEELLTIDALAAYVARSSEDSPPAVGKGAAAPAARDVPPEIRQETTGDVVPVRHPASAPSNAGRRREEAGRRSLTAAQSRYLAGFIERYQTATHRSLAHNQRFSRAACNNRRVFSAGHPELAPLQYPIVAARSAGAAIWDVDGREYVDLAMGFGVHLFGHNPPFLVRALEEQMARGLHLGPDCDLAGEVAELVCELTGFDRVHFCNSGTEAVMTAIRVARAATGRDKIALFRNAYHGHFDGTLVMPADREGDERAVPMALGTPASLTDDTILLPYDQPHAFDVIRRHAGSIAAVLVEPVQNRRPDVHPGEFLRQLRSLTDQLGILLIFDEVLVGFRVAPGGAQAWFGVAADMATYAKVLGAGLPIGVVAGRAFVMDRVDGGGTGAPGVDTTYTAGTFARNPLSLAAARAVLGQLRADGPGLQQSLNQRTSRLTGELNACFAAEGAPLSMATFGSFFRFAAAGNLSFVYQPIEADLFFHHLILRGVYVWEGRTCFLSTAHTDADVDRIVEAARGAVRDMKQGGFWPETARTPVSSPAVRALTRAGEPSLSLSFFGDYAAEWSPDKYELVFAAARFADEHGLEAIWLPERHFHSFGGFSPNPAVLASALARETRQIDIRGGSVVLPLHHPIRVAEEWALVDNLSHGRAGVSFASGWHAEDFVLAPGSFERRSDVTFEGIETVRRLWRGDEISAEGVAGADVRLRLFPLPTRPDIPIWVTTLGNPETYVRAGAIGARVLTNLINQSVEDLSGRVRMYREAYRQAGHDPARAGVTVLVHTFLGENREQAMAQAREPLCRYLSSSIDLFQRSAESLGLHADFNRLTEDDRRILFERAYERYAADRALIGTPRSCRPIVDALAAAGVDEIACFIDFGLDRETVLSHLPHLIALRIAAEQERLPDPAHAAAAPVVAVPATEEQKLLWVLAQFSPDGSAAYNLRTTIRLEGLLDLVALERAVAWLISRHESLRTVFSPDGAEQQIHPAMLVDIAVQDFSAVDAASQERLVGEWFDVDAAHTFDLQHGPLLKVAVLRLRDHLHLLVVTIHHAVCDGSSKWILLDELGAAYTALMRRTPPVLPSPEQFRTLCARRSEVARVHQTRHEAYWLGRFDRGLTPPEERRHRDNVPPVPALDLPTDRPRPALKTYRGQRLPLSLGAALYETIRRVSREHGATPFMMMLAVYLVFLHRLSGEDDLVVGVPASGRNLPGGERTVGFLTRLLPLRSVVRPEVTFDAHLNHVRRLLLEAFEHEDYSLATIVERLGICRDGRTSPLVSVTFNWDRVIEPRFAGLTASLTPRPVQHARFDLSLNVSDRGDELVVDWEYNRDLFDEGTIRSWQAAFQMLLEGALGDPRQRIVDMPIVPADDITRLVQGGRGERLDGRCECVHRRFERHAAETPASLALRDEHRSLTYRELDRAADLLAAHLCRAGVQPGDRVALHLDRSADAIVALIAVLKAGAAFVPIDPAVGDARARAIVKDVAPRAIVTATGRPSILEGVPAIALDGDLGDDDGLPPRPSQANPDALAYVLYTSGSTGTPKGVAVGHRQLSNYVDAILDRLAVPNAATFLTVSSLSVDLGFTAVFPALASGGSLHVISSDTAADPDRFVEFCKAHPIDCLKITPSHFETMLSVPRAATVLPRTQLVLGGEPLSWSLIDRLDALGARCKVMNHYGPTETTVGVTTFTVDRDAPRLGRTVPIGSPLANCEVLVLDDQLRFVPVGWPGLLYVGGEQLADGYYRDPAQTASAFIQSPFSPGVRLYATGDRARLLACGAIEHLGRADDQLKIRGFRVEPGDVEAALRSLTGVRDAAVTSRHDAAGQTLVAFVVPASGDVFDPNTARRRLTERLPAHMVPWPILPVDRIPRTPGGKIVRRSLPTAPAQQERPFVEPRGLLEQQIADVWQEVLGTERVGRDDSFFDLGGHSLSAARVASRVRHLVQIDIPLRVFIEVPTLAGLAEYIETARWALSGSSPSGRLADEDDVRLEI